MSERVPVQASEMHFRWIVGDNPRASDARLMTLTVNEAGEISVYGNNMSIDLPYEYLVRAMAFSTMMRAEHAARKGGA